MLNQRNARIPTAEKNSVFSHNILSHSDNASYKLAYIDAAEFLRPFGSKQPEVERGNSAEQRNFHH